MIPFKNTAELEEFIVQISKNFSHEVTACKNLLHALVTNYMIGARTAVDLTLSKHFKREYSSMFRAIGGYYAARSDVNNRKKRREKARQGIQNCLLDLAVRSNENIYSFFLDMTGNIKKHSPKMPDRSYIYSNGNIEIGHTYSAVCIGAGDGWMLPVSMQRVPSSENKFNFAVSQLEPIMRRLPKNALSVYVGDSAYCCNKFIHPLNQHKNAVSITRVRSNKVIFTRYIDTKNGVGRKRVYGTKYSLTQRPLPEADLVKIFEETTSRGKIQQVKLSLFKNYICKGSKGYKMSEVPGNFLKVEVFNEDGSKKYPRDLWLEIVGKRKDEITIKQAYYKYKERFDIEHFFKFGKSKLLLDKFQTTNPEKEEDFILFGMIAYNLLYYAKNLLKCAHLKKWENKDKVNIKSPWHVYRAAAYTDIFNILDSGDLKERGIPTIKNIRKTFTISENQPIVRKEHGSKLEIAIKSMFGKHVCVSKTSINVNRELPLAQISAKTQEICSKIWAQAG